jgi:hypothetical protein
MTSTAGLKAVPFTVCPPSGLFAHEAGQRQTITPLPADADGDRAQVGGDVVVLAMQVAEFGV